MSSPSSSTYFELFKTMSDIVEKDTGGPMKFFYLHNEGCETMMADGDKAQALGEPNKLSLPVRFSESYFKVLEYICNIDAKIIFPSAPQYRTNDGAISHLTST